MKMRLITLFAPVFAWLLAAGFLSPDSACAEVGYDDDTELDFVWTPPQGSFAYYNVYVSVDGGDYQLEPEHPSAEACAVSGQDGHTYQIKVAAATSEGVEGPFSPESDPVICDTLPPLSPVISETYDVLDQNTVALSLDGGPTDTNFSNYQVLGGQYSEWTDTPETTQFVFSVDPDSQNVLQIREKDLAGNVGAAASLTVENLNGDDDSDGIPNYWEYMYREILDAENPNDANLDSDGDGWSNYEEFVGGTDPTRKDSFPQDTTPPSVSCLTGNTSATGGESVTISATLEDNVGVAEAWLYYKSASDPSWSSLDFLSGSASLPIAVGSTEDIYYFITADDAAGNGPVGDPSADGSVHYTITVLHAPQTLNLHAGSNLVGISHQPLDPSCDSIFGDAAVGSVLGWDGSESVEVTSVEPLRAYWVITTAPVSVQYDYIPISDPTPNFTASWNAFAVAEETPLPLPYPEVVGSVWGWDGTKYVRAESALQPHKGYWVAAEAAGKGSTTGPGENIREAAESAYFAVDLASTLDSQAKHSLKIGLLSSGESESKDTVPPPEVSGFDYYISSGLEWPWNKLSMYLIPQVSGQRLYSWTVVMVVPTSEEATISWDASGAPADVSPYFVEVDLVTGEPTGDPQDMKTTTSLAIQGGAIAPTTKAFEFRMYVNLPPVLDSIGDKTTSEDQELSFQLSATDPDRDTLTYSASPLPSGVSLNSSTGIFSWTPAFGQSGDYSVTFTVTDDAFPSESDSETINIVVLRANRPPSIESVSVSPATAYTNTTLTATPWGWSDPDGDSPGYRYQWGKNGGNISGATSPTLAGTNFVKGDVITCQVAPWDGTDTGASKLSNSVTIRNGAPSVSSVSVSPTTAYTNTTLTATPSGWSDPDGDSPGYRYQWQKNGGNISGATSPTLAGTNFVKGDVITCQVAPWDGTDIGTSKLSNSVTIRNGAPSISSVSVSPATAYTNTNLTATPWGWSDPDGDSPGYRYQWKKNGGNISGATSPTLAATNFVKGDVITCQVAPWDGADTGTSKLSNSVTIRNGVPSISSVSVSPTTAYTNTTLTATPSGWSDPDGDSPGYRYQWKKNGGNISGATSPTLAGTNFVKGDAITCQVTPWDGDDTGTPKLSNAVTILDACRTLNLVAGWNLVGISRQAINPSTSSVFGGVAVGTVWGWDGARYVPAATLEPLQSYWVPTVAPASVEYDCLPVSDPSPNFSHTWNMFAVADETPLPLDYGNVVGSIWGWDGTKYVRENSPLHPDKGYWVATQTMGTTGSARPPAESDEGIVGLTLNMKLSGVEKGYLELRLLDGDGSQVLDPAPPASPDGFTCYILGEGPTPFDRLSKKVSILRENSERFSWTVVAQVPAGEEFSLSWDTSSLPKNVVLTIAELNLEDALPKSGSFSMADRENVSCSATVPSTFAWRVEATCRLRASNDADGNLIADDWERQYFGQAGCDPEGDEDHDGMTNLEEFTAGTRPTDDSHLLAIWIIQKTVDGNGMVVSWESATDRKYQVLYTDSLLGEWRCLGTEIEGTGRMIIIQHDTGIADTPHRFYRLRVW